jgi:general secretion pathway protein K
VVVALLVVALVAGIAAAAVADFGIALDGAVGRHDQAQARQLARAAIDWGRNVLAEDARTSVVDHAGEPWAVKVPATPVEDGEVGGEIVDCSGRFDLNSLVRNGVAEEPAVARFVGLLQALGLPPDLARQQADSLVDWLDADDLARSPESAESAWYAMQERRRMPPGSPMPDTHELALVRGFAPELVSRLLPLVTALPAPSGVNVNTAPPEVLMAMMPGVDQEAAQLLIAERNRAWFKDMADFAARLPALDRQTDLSGLTTSSRYFMAVVRARYGVSTVRMEALLDRERHWSEILWLQQS